MTSIIPRLPYLWEEICGTAPAPTPAPTPEPTPTPTPPPAAPGPQFTGNGGAPATISVEEGTVDLYRFFTIHGEAPFLWSVSGGPAAVVIDSFGVPCVLDPFRGQQLSTRASTPSTSTAPTTPSFRRHVVLDLRPLPNRELPERRTHDGRYHSRQLHLPLTGLPWQLLTHSTFKFWLRRSRAARSQSRGRLLSRLMSSTPSGVRSTRPSGAAVRCRSRAVAASSTFFFVFLTKKNYDALDQQLT